MREIKVTFVVPPKKGGVMDYADIVADALATQGCTTHVFSWEKENPDDIDKYILKSDCIYLQYSGYGYATRGAPLWLLHELKKKRARIKKLGVFFHELYAIGPPWGSAFWLSPLQRYIVERLVNLSDFWTTNRDASFVHLKQRSSPTQNGTLLPVISNVGEATSPNSHRAPEVIVFGSPALREKTYLLAGESLFSWARMHEVAIHDIGSPLATPQQREELSSKGVIFHGRLEPWNIARLMSEAALGLLAYPVDCVAKSGVFAAYCAHGLAPILISRSYKRADGLEENRHYLPKEILDEPNLPSLDRVARNAFNWYSRHNLEKHASCILNELAS